jgi:hypothetical protein
MPPTNEQNDLLARLDERFAAFQKSFEEMKDEIRETKDRFVSRDEFAPVRAIVFGAVGLVLVAFMGTLIYLTGLRG